MNETLQIMAQNIKCGGCASAIENGLKPLSGVEQVTIEIDSGRVTVDGDNLSEQQIRDKLAELGYPPAE